MAVYVDRPMSYPPEVLKTQSLRYGDKWSHLWADDLAELHGMARSINLQGSWFQDRLHFPHYDLVPTLRRAALRKGAQENTIQAWLTASRAALQPQADQIRQIITPYLPLVQPGDFLKLSEMASLIAHEGLPFGRLSDEAAALLGAHEGYVTFRPDRVWLVTLYPDFGRNRLTVTP